MERKRLDRLRHPERRRILWRVASFINGMLARAAGGSRPLIPAILARAVREFADATALVDGDRTFTYRAVASRVARLAALLRAAGVAPGDRVAPLPPDSGPLLPADLAAAPPA